MSHTGDEVMAAKKSSPKKMPLPKPGQEKVIPKGGAKLVRKPGGKGKS